MHHVSDVIWRLSPFQSQTRTKPTPTFASNTHKTVGMFRLYPCNEYAHFAYIFFPALATTQCQRKEGRPAIPKWLLWRKDIQSAETSGHLLQFKSRSNVRVPLFQMLSNEGSKMTTMASTLAAGTRGVSPSPLRTRSTSSRKGLGKTSRNPGAIYCRRQRNNAICGKFYRLHVDPRTFVKTRC